MVAQSDDLKEVREDNETSSKNEEPVVCSKCNITFETDEKYLRHYEQVHKSEIR
jgi:hypothetical protein